MGGWEVGKGLVTRAEGETRLEKAHPQGGPRRSLASVGPGRARSFLRSSSISASASAQATGPSSSSLEIARLPSPRPRPVSSRRTSSKLRSKTEKGNSPAGVPERSPGDGRNGKHALRAAGPGGARRARPRLWSNSLYADRRERPAPVAGRRSSRCWKPGLIEGRNATGCLPRRSRDAREGTWSRGAERATTE